MYRVEKLGRSFKTYEDAREALINAEEYGVNAISHAIEQLVARDPSLGPGWAYISACIDYVDMQFEYGSMDAWYEYEIKEE